MYVCMYVCRISNLNVKYLFLYITEICRELAKNLSMAELDKKNVYINIYWYFYMEVLKQICHEVIKERCHEVNRHQHIISNMP
jgi:hypothetical protein